jgi:hypothetical protein
MAKYHMICPHFLRWDPFEVHQGSFTAVMFQSIYNGYFEEGTICAEE